MKTLAAVGLLLAVLAVVGCGGDAGRNSPPTPTQEPASATPPARTGIPEVDAIIEAVLSGDTDALRPYVGLQTLPCIGPTPGYLGALFCAPDEPEGTIVEILPVSQCESHYVRAEELADTISSFQSGDPKLYAAYSLFSEPGSDPGYRVVFSVTKGSEGRTLGESLLISGQVVVGIDFGCGEPPEQFQTGDGASLLTPIAPRATESSD